MQLLLKVLKMSLKQQAICRVEFLPVKILREYISRNSAPYQSYYVNTQDGSRLLNHVTQ